MQALAVRRQQPLVRDLSDPLMGEVETLTDRVKDPAPDELFNAFGGLRRAELGRVLEEREIELTTDDAGHGGQAPRAVAEPVEARGDDLTYPMRHARLTGRFVGFALLQSTDGLEHHERISLAGAPHRLAEPLDCGFVGPRLQQRSDERRRLRLRKRR